MNRKDLLKTLISDNQNQPLPSIWKRNLTLPLHSKKIITLSGVRRSGKTYHLFNLIQTLKNKKINPQRILYLNFEDERLNLTIKEMNLILQAYQELYPSLDLSKSYFFFDEIQEVAGWEKFIARVYNTLTKNIFITGSNSSLLSQEIASSLRGRNINFEVYPLSFLEYVNVLAPHLNPQTSSAQATLKKLFQQFIQWGGFPEIVKAKKNLKTHILQQYFDVMILRDLIERYQISQPATLKYFAKRLIGNTACQFSAHKIYNELKSQGYKISKDTIYSFQAYAQAIYLSCFIPQHSHSVVKREFSQKKVYSIDTGLASSLDYKLAQDQGRLLETTVALEFIKQGKQINYLQNGFECNFLILEKDQPVQAIQVCLNLEDENTQKRETTGLLKACQALNLKKATIITLDQQAKIKQKNINISIRPAWKYFL